MPRWAFQLSLIRDVSRGETFVQPEQVEALVQGVELIVEPGEVRPRAFQPAELGVVPTARQQLMTQFVPQQELQ